MKWKLYKNIGYLYYNITIYIISKEDKLEAVRHSFLAEICVHDSAFNIDSGQVSDESANSHWHTDKIPQSLIS